MDSFKLFLEQQDFVDMVLEQFNAPNSYKPVVAATAGKPWSAKKDQIMQIWQTARGDVPIYMTPIQHAPGQELQTYGEDGIRITGSWQFITSMMGRLKEMLQLENPNTRLRLIFRGVDDSKMTRPDRQSFVFYCNLEPRGHGRAGRPRKNNLNLPKGI